MAQQGSFSDRDLLDRMAQAIAFVRTGGPPRGELQQRRFLMEARRQLRGLCAAGLASSFDR